LPIGACRACHAAEPQVVLDLGTQPRADSFPETPDTAEDAAWPLVLGRCPRCGLFQLLGDSPPEEDLVGAAAWTSSTTMAAHVDRLIDELVDAGLLGPGARVVDLASHGGHTAPLLRRRGIEATVYESVPWRAAELRDLGHPVVDADPEVISTGTAAAADLVIDVYRLAHLPDLDAGVAALARLLAPGGTAVIEFDHALSTIGEAQFDALRHGHFSYLTLEALGPLLASHGLVVTHAAAQPVYGGALRIRVRPAGAIGPGAIDPSVEAIRDAERAAGLDDPAFLAGLAGRVAERCDALRAHLAEAAAAGRHVVGYGAPTRAVTLLNAARITARDLPFTVDRSRAKHGRYLPGTGIPIRDPGVLAETPPDELLILAWDLADEVVAQLPELAGHTRFVVPLPDLADIGPAASARIAR
jgi:SAM-dependent methyltransferase